MKSFTTIEQSLELAKFLPKESADMVYLLWPTKGYLLTVLTQENITDVDNTDILCWSMRALMQVLPPVYTDKDGNDLYLTIRKTELWSMGYEHGLERDLWQYGHEPVDMLYNLIIELHKREIL